MIVLNQVAGVINDVNTLVLAIESIKASNGKESYSKTLISLLDTLNKAIEGLKEEACNFNFFVSHIVYSNDLEETCKF
ncbi:MAG: hypothetical protein HQK76_20060 [Desulfobacterales bacterium]|nr:hypothetical protein [Desulfobacterales bacterium]